MRAALMGVVVWVVSSGCQHVLRESVNPNAKSLVASCRAAFDQAPGVALDWRQVGARCAPIFQKQACRNAWSMLSQTPSAEEFSQLAEACARDYCPRSTRHAVTACEEPPPPFDGRKMRDVISFALSRELGLENLGRVWKPLMLSLSPLPGGAVSSGSGQNGYAPVVNTVNQTVAGCFGKAMVSLPEKERADFSLGVMVLDVIAPNGELEGVEIFAATERMQRFEDCVLSAHGTLTFPADREGKRVNFLMPYVFLRSQ